MSFKGHRLTLFLSREHERALIQLQAEMDLGRSFAGLLLVTEGLYKRGKFTEEQHEKFVRRYSTPLTKPAQKWKQNSELKSVEEQFSTAIKNWPDMKDKARIWYLTKAEQYRGKVKNADIILALATKETPEMFSHG